MRNLAWVVVFLAVVGMAGCGEAEKPAEQPAAQKEEPKPQYETGRAALQRLYVTARGWAADAQPYEIESQYTPGAPVEEGKAGIWRARFASPSRGTVKAFLWSGISGEGLPERGVTPSTEDAYNPRNVATQPFDVNFLKVDTEKAFEVAQEKGGAKLLKQKPDLPVAFALQFESRQNRLDWWVSYGGSRTSAELSVAVNATTGEFIRKTK